MFPKSDRLLGNGSFITSKGTIINTTSTACGRRHLVHNARRIVTEKGNTEIILLAMVTIDILEIP